MTYPRAKHTKRESADTKKFRQNLQHIAQYSPCARGPGSQTQEDPDNRPTAYSPDVTVAIREHDMEGQPTPRSQDKNLQHIAQSPIKRKQAQYTRCPPQINAVKLSDFPLAEAEGGGERGAEEKSRKGKRAKRQHQEEQDGQQTRPTAGMHVRNPPTTCTQHNRNGDSETASLHAQHNGPGDDGETEA